MTKIRVIPFGYQMENGKMTVRTAEAKAVQEIFRIYLDGKTPQQISDIMLIPYADGVVWSVSYVRKILNNTVYLGTEQYSRLIEPELFEAVQELKRSKAHCLHRIPEDMTAVRSLSVCKECGQKIYRCGGLKKPERWYCNRHGCRKPLVRITDKMMFTAVLNILNAVTANPDLVNSDIPETSYSPNQEIVRQQNEIRRMMENPSVDYERVKAEIYRLAEMKYSCCEYNDIPLKTAELKSILSQSESLNTINVGLLKSCIRRILVSRFCTIEAEFINGVTINERGEKA